MRTKLFFANFFVLFAHFNVQIAEAAIVYTGTSDIITFSVAKVQNLKDNKQRACMNNTTLNISQLKQGVYIIVTESDKIRAINKVAISR